jgi:hypothetical protein
MELGKRKYERCAFPQIIKYSISSYIDDKASTALLHDFSYSGLCIITHDPLQNGQEIRVKSSLTNNSITAIVRWCSDLGNNTYKIGLELKH